MNDEALYQLYMNGQEEAADELVQRYGDALTLYIHGFLGDISEAEDLMIEAFSLMFSKKRPIDGDGSFKGYLYRVARNLAYRYQSKAKIRFFSLEELNFELSSEAMEETMFSGEERKKELYDAMAGLKEEYREALYLVYFEEMSYKEAAHVMRKTESQITKLVYRGKQSLKHKLEQEGFVYGDSEQ